VLVLAADAERRFIDGQRRALACRRKQEWLDVSQGWNAYLEEMDERAAVFGKESGVFEFAEGWIRHNPLGLGPEGFDPLAILFISRPPAIGLPADTPGRDNGCAARPLRFPESGGRGSGRNCR